MIPQRPDRPRPLKSPKVIESNLGVRWQAQRDTALDFQGMTRIG
jgi:hypothetical protein